MGWTMESEVREFEKNIPLELKDCIKVGHRFNGPAIMNACKTVYCRIRGKRVSEALAVRGIQAVDLLENPEYLLVPPMVVLDSFRILGREKKFGEYDRYNVHDWLFPSGKVGCNFYTNRGMSLTGWVQGFWTLVEKVEGIDCILMPSVWLNKPTYVVSRDYYEAYYSGSQVLPEIRLTQDELLRTGSVEKFQRVHEEFMSKLTGKGADVLKAWPYPKVNWWELEEKNFYEPGWVGFEESCLVGLWFHDRTLEVLPAEQLRDKWLEYESQSGGDYESRKLGPGNEGLQKIYCEQLGITSEEFEVKKRRIEEGIPGTAGRTSVFG